MFVQTAKRSLAAMACCAALFHAVPAQAAGMSIRTLGASQMHLASIGYRIAAANARSCARPDMLTGMILHDLTQYDPSVRPAVSRAFSLDGGYGVLQLVPGSAAQRAGIQIDDEILAVGGRWVADLSAVQRPGKSSRRVGQFSELLSASLQHGATDLLVRRNGRQLTLRLHGQAGCGGDVTLANSATLNAWSDGRHVVVSSAMAQMARSDDELAFVIAHEMAHNSLGHAGSSAGDARGLFGLLGLGAARIKRMEIDADSYAVALMSAGGYAPEAGISFLQNARRRLWWSVSLDHPGFGRRMQIVGAAIARLPSRNAHYQLAGNNAGPTLAPAASATNDISRPHSQAFASLSVYNESALDAISAPAQLASVQTH
jgi:peptidase M48-like protein